MLRQTLAYLLFLSWRNVFKLDLDRLQHVLTIATVHSVQPLPCGLAGNQCSRPNLCYSIYDLFALKQNLHLANFPHLKFFALTSAMF